MEGSMVYHTGKLYLFNFLHILKSVQEIPVKQKFGGCFCFLLGRLLYNLFVTKYSITILQRHFIKVPHVVFTLRWGVDSSCSNSFSSLFTGAVCNSSITFKIKIDNLKIKGVHQTRWCFYISVECLLIFIIHQNSFQSIVHETWTKPKFLQQFLSDSTEDSIRNQNP